MSRLTRLASGYRASAQKGTPTPGSQGRLPGSNAGLGMSIDLNSIAGRGGVKAATISTRYTTPGQPQYEDFDAQSATRLGYLGHSYVMRCVRLRAETVAGLPFVCGPDMGQSDVQNMEAPMARFLGPATTDAPGGPNPHTTARAHWIWSIVQRIVSGRMAWELQLDPSTKEIEGLWPLVSYALHPMPATVDKKGNPTFFDGYQYFTPLGVVDMKDEQVFYDWRMSAEDPRQSESVIQAASLPIQIAIALDKYMWSILSKGMMASKMVIAPPFEDPADERAWEDQFFSEFSGYDNAGKTIFAYAENDYDQAGKMVDQATVQVVDLTLKNNEAQLINFSEQAKTDIEIALGVPESLIGSSKQRIYANADSEYRNYWTTTVINDIAELQDAVNLRLAPRLGKEVGWFDLSQVAALQPPMLFAPPDIDKMLADGVLTVPDVVKILNLGALEAPSEDIGTAPIGEELAEGASVMQRSAAVWTARTPTRAYHGSGYRAVHHGMRLAPNTFAKRLPLNTKTLTDGIWQVETRRERIVTVEGHRAETPQLALDILVEVSRRNRRREMGIRSVSALKAAGIAVKAADTGRVLMLQRALDDRDPASGKFEFPGGHIEPGEDSLDAAQREWSEEVGVPFPDGNVAGSWTSPNGVYRGHVHVVPSESAVKINSDKPKVRNPDNPRGKYQETAVWMDPEHIADNPAVRDEVKDSHDTWAPVVKAARSIDEGSRSIDFDALALELLASVQ